ncbi:hypothetical protein LJ737_17020 [Hymenobacter sp. 15J16-1T3B]|uniref:hypothetical protein n=1 Tax=Hymenobacter sp. 15J16-1T3B TaxID=2886941 RepID=UPI001D10D81F|nr:hypothetical protein [Hymenobacter sp. 15J16-1T3B]MCC3158948.1 hypothetical protein [Hymenobacter sp. 15J16-1T3B]
MTPEELLNAGFLSARAVTATPQYSDGQLYVRLTPTGALRVFVPTDRSQEVELSTGNLLNPEVLYRGSVRDVVALLRHWS